MKPVYLLLSAALIITACARKRKHEHYHGHGTNYVTQVQNLKKTDVGNGEFVYQMEGKDYNSTMSFVITETYPGGGPPLHYHESEEAHIVLNGTVTYFIDDSIFTVEGPYIVNVPAGAHHTFMNSGDSVLNLVAVFAQNSFGSYNPIGENPLLK